MSPSFSRGIAFTWVFGLFGVVITALSLAYNVHLHRAAELERAERITRILVDLVTDDAGRILYGVEQLLGGLEPYLVPAPDRPAIGVPEVDGVLARRAAENPYLVDLLLLDAEGRVLQRGRGEGRLEPPGSDFARAHREIRRDGAFVSEPFRAPEPGGRWLFGVSRAVRGADGAVRWILLALVDVARFNTVYEGLERLPGSTLLLASSHGTVYLRIPGEGSGTGERSAVARRFWDSGLGVAGGFDEGCRDALPCIATARRVEGYPLVALAGVDRGGVLARSREVTWTVAVIGILIGGGILALTVMLVREQRAQQRAAEALERMACEDYLTGLFNRRELMNRTAEELERAHRYGGALSLVMLDVDHFKRINDRHGHPVGDLTLRRVAEVLRDCSRRTDLVGRYGGEEFLLVLPETSLGGAHRVAEKVRVRLEACRIDEGAVEIRFTASLGVVQYDGRESLESLVARADEALYRAKGEGRNRVVSEGVESTWNGGGVVKRAVGSGDVA